MPYRPIQAGLQPCRSIAVLPGDFLFGIARRKQIRREPFTSFKVILAFIACAIEAEYRNSEGPPRPQIHHSRERGLVAIRFA